MLKVTFAKSQGGSMWVKGRSLTWDELDGWTMESFRGDSQGHEPGGTWYAPAGWQIVQVEEE